MFVGLGFLPPMRLVWIGCVCVLGVLAAGCFGFVVCRWVLLVWLVRVVWICVILFSLVVIIGCLVII